MKLFRTANKHPRPSRTEALACTPVISALIDWQQDDSGAILIEYPLTVKPLFQSLLQRFTKQPPQRLTKKLQLDGMGSDVWQLIDGEDNVKTIIEKFACQHALTRHEAELSVTAFLRELGRRGLISLR